MSVRASMKLKQWRPEVANLPLYNAGLTESAVRAKYELKHVTKLASNENPYANNPAITAALQKWFSALHQYPDPQCIALRERVTHATGVPLERVLCGNGSEELIEMLCMALLNPGDRVVTLAPSFGLHEIFSLVMGAIVEKVPVGAAFQFDLDAWRAAMAQTVKLIMFSTPSNPVGTALNDAQLMALVTSAPDDAFIVVDEAYYEYARGPGYANSLAILSAQHRPWIVLRTFSKAFGLAGLRVGYALASDPEVVSVLNCVRTPFNVNGAAQVAAIAAMECPDYVAATVAATIREREALRTRVIAIDERHGYGLRVAPSCGNFLFIDTRRPSCRIAEGLLRRGVIVKPWFESGFETFIRVSVARDVDSDHFLRAFDEVLAAA